MKAHELRRVDVVWCDDIRHEVGNKPSLMGVYTAGLVVQRPTTPLPRLAAWITVHTPKDKPFKKIELRLMRNDASLPVAEVGLDDQFNFQPASDESSEGAIGIVLSVFVLFGPLVITEDTHWFKVFADTGDEVLESFKLKVQGPPTN